jgi:hypothetical protein
MTARTFAKPFGGRIGPWYRSGWAKGAENSTGDKVDEMLPPRREPGGAEIDPNDKTRLVNYSRYPGDPYGMKTHLALNSIKGLKTLTLSYSYYQNIKQDFSLSDPNDILAWDIEKNGAPAVRDMEIAAIAPDLFDITYYSIEPNFSKNYFPKMKAHRKEAAKRTGVLFRPR